MSLVRVVNQTKSITSSPTVGDYRNWGKLAKPYTAKALRGMRLSFEKEHEATMIPRHILVSALFLS
jgi:hypothetical protein